MDELNRAYEALQKAHDAGDEEGAKQIAAYAKTLEDEIASKSKAENYEKSAQDEGLNVPESVIGASLGAPVGAIAGPAIGAAVDTAANVGAKMINPQAAGLAGMPESNSPAAVRKWLATQTSNPYAGGKDYEEASLKSKIAAGKPVQSRGANVPIRKGRLGIGNQLPETTLPQKAAANIINAEKLGKPGISRRIIGTGIAGAEVGNLIEEAKKGNVGRAALSGLGALGGAASQSHIKPIRAIGTGLSVAVPAIQYMLPDEEEVQKKAQGGLIHMSKAGAVKEAVKKVKGFLEHTPTKPNELVGTRYKTTDLGGLIEPTPFDIEKAIGAKVMHRPYDLSSRNQLVEEVSGHKLINPVLTEGGQPFGRDIKLQATGQGGASNKNINDKILKRVDVAAQEGNGQVFNIPSTMGYGSEAFSTMPMDILLDLIKQRELPKEQLEYLSNLVRAKSPALQNFVGFGHPEVAKQLTEGGFGLTTTPGKLRVGATQAMMGKQSGAQSLIDYNQEDLFNAIRAPELRNVPPGYMGETVMEAVPGHPGFSTGNHGAYDSGDASIYRGQGINAPISLWMPDTYKQALAEIRANPKTAEKALGHQRAMARNVLGTAESGVAQTITPQVADNLQRYQEAIKEGKLSSDDLDAIHKYIYGDKAHEYAKGGKVAAEVIEAFKKKFTPGFYHGSPSPDITSFDPLKSKVRDVDFVTPGVTFVTKSPKFADSFTNGKGPYISLKTGEAMPAQSYTKGATMYPVSVDMSNHFDPTTPEGREVVRAYVAQKYADNPEMARKFMSRIEDPHSNWTTMESPSFLQHLRDTGHTSFAVNESGYPNVGVLDPSKIRGKFAKYNPEDAESPDFMKAKGGKVGALESLVKPAVNRINMHFKDVTKRIPELQESAQNIMAGTGSREAHEALVNAHKPVAPFQFVPTPATREEAVNALHENKKALYGVPSQTLQAGHPVGLRLDIPAYSEHGVWVPTVHEQASGFGAGKTIGHESVASVLNPAFGMSDKAALSIASGKPKGTIATIKGEWNPVEHEQAVANAQEYLNHPEWRQVGMDPERHSYFYDRETMEPITHAEEALQIGPLVLAKKPVYGKKEDFKFKVGGKIKKKK